jgi:prolyl-tRNA synthetase
VSTRLIGGLIMTHSDDDGLICPPRLAPKHVVLLPIYRNEEEKSQILEYCHKVKKELEGQLYMGAPIRVELDARDIRGGEKTWQHIKKGTPIRAEVGPRDMQADSLFVARRDQGVKDKKGVNRADFIQTITETLDSIQRNLFDRALALRESRTREFTDYNEFSNWFTPKNEDKPEIHGGFAIAYWSADPAAAKEINDKLATLKVSPRCIPLGDKAPEGRCLFTGRPTSTRVIFAKNY